MCAGPKDEREQTVVLEKAKNVRLMLLDVDGVLTTGALYYDGKGEALKIFNVRDGTGIKWLQRAGVEVALLSGRESQPLWARARELGIKSVMAPALKKLPVFTDFITARNLDPQTIAYMGDDLIDLPVLRRVGLSLAPADAVPEVKAVVDWVSAFPGGTGAVREAVELILKAKDLWEGITASYRE